VDLAGGQPLVVSTAAKTRVAERLRIISGRKSRCRFLLEGGMPSVNYWSVFYKNGQCLLAGVHLFLSSSHVSSRPCFLKRSQTKARATSMPTPAADRRSHDQLKQAGQSPPQSVPSRCRLGCRCRCTAFHSVISLPVAVIVYPVADPPCLGLSGNPSHRSPVPSTCTGCWRGHHNRPSPSPCR